MNAMIKDVVSPVRSDAVGNAQQAAGGAELTVFALRDRLSRFQATRNGLAVLLLVIDVTLFGIGQALVLSASGSARSSSAACSPGSPSRGCS